LKTNFTAENAERAEKDFDLLLLGVLCDLGG
jgi:hypothetical protein